MNAKQKKWRRRRPEFGGADEPTNGRRTSARRKPGIPFIFYVRFQYPFSSGLVVWLVLTVFLPFHSASFFISHANIRIRISHQFDFFLQNFKFQSELLVGPVALIEKVLNFNFLQLLLNLLLPASSLKTTERKHFRCRYLG